MADTIGAIQVVATINTKDYDAAKKKIEEGNRKIGSDAEKTSNRFAGAWTGAIAGIAASLTGKFLGAVTSSIGSAVKRVDTLNNSARTFRNMGIDAIDSSKAMDALEKSIKGLPTPLDAAVRGMTDLTATYGDIDKGQKVFSALNNAILGFGGSSEMVSNAITQLSQLPLDGPLDAQTWNSLRNSGITPVLTAMAKDSGMSVAQMKEAFGKGELTVQDFTDRLLKLNKKGGGGLTSLERIAKDSTAGIGTGFANMQTAITRGVAKIIESIGSENISAAITGIGNAFTVALDGVAGLINFISDNKDLFASLAVGVIGATAAIVGYNTVIKIAKVYQSALNTASILYSAYTNAMSAGLGRATAAQIAMNIAMKANPIGIIITLIAALVTGLVYFFSQTETGKKVMQGFFGFMVDSFDNLKKMLSGLGGFFKGVWSTITGIFGKIGISVGNAIAGAVKGVVNSILGFAEGTINGFIKAINIAIDAINHIPGVNIGKLGLLNIPRLADGAYVKHRPGGILANIGEGREDEVVAPLSKLEAMTGDDNPTPQHMPDINVTIQARTIDSRNDLRNIAIETIEVYNEILVSKGMKPLPT